MSDTIIYTSSNDTNKNLVIYHHNGIYMLYFNKLSCMKQTTAFLYKYKLKLIAGGGMYVRWCDVC